MNKTVELVTKWASFEAMHPDASIEDFCRQYLVSIQQQNENELFGGIMPPATKTVLAKLIDRIAKLHMIYIGIAIRDLELRHFEEFTLLSTIDNLKSPKKTEAIHYTLNEMTTGLTLLANLMRQGYIKEYNDSVDKRSKRLEITVKGKKILKACYTRFSKVPEILFKDMAKDEIQLCIQLLKTTEFKFSAQANRDKGKTFDEVYTAIVGEQNAGKKIITD